MPQLLMESPTQCLYQEEFEIHLLLTIQNVNINLFHYGIYSDPQNKVSM